MAFAPDVCERRVLTNEERVGLFFAVLSSVTSILAVAAVFAGLTHRIFDNLRTPNHMRRPIIKTHLDVYVAIAIHTFLVIALKWTPSRSFRVPIIAVFVMWSYQVIFLVSLLASHRQTESLFAPLPYWCWLSRHYAQLRLPAVYFWHWLTVAGSVVLYVPLFFVIRGNLEFGHDYVPRLQLRRIASPVERIGNNFSVTSQSKKMLMYPIAYVVLLIPFTSIRWSGDFSHRAGQDVHIFFFFVSLYFLNGLANVLLLVFTRPSILGFSRDASQTPGDNVPSTGVVSTAMFGGSIAGEEVRILTKVERIGLFFAVLSIIASMLATTSLFACLAYRALRNLKLPRYLRRPIITTHLDVYVWGYFNTLDNWPEQAIAIHTFMVIAFKWIPPRSFTIPFTVVSVLWCYQVVILSVLVAVRRSGNPLFAPLPYWCWLSRHYAWLRLPSVYFWYWFTVAASIFLYVPLFFVIRGNIEFGQSYVPYIRLRRVPSQIERADDHLSLSNQSRKMLVCVRYGDWVAVN
ncbi:hypothetical protein AURDEDRAFT_176807 [Auricularia subglabra TFB-10046 SS5]|uniref:Uncharacterized protein n=1 Tax=Auricularia subglabra (strain TFB-10046 / SS5) TaxID=717982 RepID=J0LCC0_AURST|nr:hypothetical protein AURDEDRAFT_176807 [Auricularia subglabra TFB-10046 SS5]